MAPIDITVPASPIGPAETEGPLTAAEKAAATRPPCAEADTARAGAVSGEEAAPAPTEMVASAAAPQAAAGTANIAVGPATASVGILTEAEATESRINRRRRGKAKDDGTRK